MAAARIEQQFLAAYDPWRDALYRHIYFRVHSRERAEELLQETFMKTWQYCAAGERVENLRAFLYRVARNLIIDESRRRKEESLDSLRDAYGFDPPDEHAVTIEHGALAREIFQALDKLPDDEREIITMRYVDEFEPREIAEILKITPNAASVRLYRATEALKHIVDSPPRP